MGIRGLWKKVQADSLREGWKFDDNLHRQAVLLVDGAAFVFHLIDQQLQLLHPSCGFEKKYGGSYRHIQNLMKLEIDRLQRTLGFELLFYFDGADSYYKGNTTAKRRMQMLENWENMYYAGLGDGENVEEASLPLSPLSIPALHCVLEELSIRCVDCEHEADQKMALDCFNLNEGGGEIRFYCYTGDSDFLLMKNCQVIKLGELDHLTLSVATGEVSVNVYSRQKLSHFYGIEESLLVHLGILAGNDFTEHFPRVDLYPKGVDSYVGCLDDLMTAIDEDSLRVEPDSISDEDFRQAVLFSFAFYDLEDLQPFLLEKYKTKNQLELLPDIDDGLQLNVKLKSSLRQWLITKAPSMKTGNGQELARIAMQFLEEISSASYRSLPQAQGDGAAVVTADHIEGLKRMNRSIFAGLLEECFSDSKLIYQDQLVANFYQLIVRELSKHARSVHGLQQKFSPSDCYDGVTFHSVMLKLRQQKEKTKIPTNANVSDLAEKLQNLMLQAKVISPPSGTTTAGTTAGDAVKSALIPQKPLPTPLPTDAYREQILSQIEKDRVTIIHGETGCGKSSRVPLFILEDHEEKKKYCKIMITQPRRIAVLNLKRRLHDQLGDKIGMRMGHGVKEESVNTKIYFVTTGYLVKLLAHHPTALASISHIIIDEVHERSMDSDLLCWLARQHLAKVKDTRLVLMSATLHTSLYSTYFHDGTVMKNAPTSLSVGLRRFPVQINYVEDLVESNELPPRMASVCNLIAKNCTPHQDAKVGNFAVPQSLAKAQYDAAIALVRAKGILGTGVLIFVSGIADIVELQSRFEGLDRYEIVAIHSDIPFEEQEAALTPPEPHQVKVILATNAAESSVTLPNVDVVICLGTHKAVCYKAGDILRSTLENTWVSKSSAIQRAGRTGRIRPGTVYRLYTKALYERFVDFEEAEIHRKPLHETVLSLKATFQDAHDHHGVVPILTDMLESPDLSKVDDCFEYLYRGKMISAPDDSARLTSLGQFAGHMPLDVSLSNLIIFGISLGVGPEAIVAAAALAQPKSPFRIAHPIIHTDPMEYNSIIRQTFLGANHFDQGTYSDPIMMINLMSTWITSNPQQQFKLCQQHGFVSARMKHFVSFANHMLHQVNQLLGEIGVSAVRDEGRLNFVSLSPIPAAKINRLRLSMLWALDYNLICSIGRREKKNDFDADLNALLANERLGLSASVLEELFPQKLIAREVSIKGTYVHEIPPPYIDTSELGVGLRKLVSFLIANEEAYFVACSFSVLGKEDKSNTGGGKKGKAKKSGGVSQSVNVFFAVRQNNGRCSHFVDYLSKSVGTRPRWCGDLDSSSVQEDIPPLSVFAFDNIDDGSYSRFVAFVQNICGLNITVLSDGTARLLAIDLKLDADTIKSFYDTKIRAKIHAFDAQIETAAFPVKTYNTYQRVKFLPGPTTATIGTDLKSPLPSPPFEDLQLGMRLFNAYCLGHRDKKMKYRKLSSAEGGSDDEHEGSSENVSHARKLVPGTAEWVRQKDHAKESTGEDASMPTAAVRVNHPTETFQMGAVVSPWKIVAGKWVAEQGDMEVDEGKNKSGSKKQKNKNKKTKQQQNANNLDDEDNEEGDDFGLALHNLHAIWNGVIMSHRSVIAASCHGPFPHQERCPPLYGVAYSAMGVGSANPHRQQMVVVEGVTLFPVGEQWVRKGLLSVGKRLDDDAEYLVDEAESSVDDPEYTKPLLSRRKLCAFIYQLVNSFVDRDIAQDLSLIRAVDMLFADDLAGRRLTEREELELCHQLDTLVRAAAASAASSAIRRGRSAGFSTARGKPQLIPMSQRMAQQKKANLSTQDRTVTEVELPETRKSKIKKQIQIQVQAPAQEAIKSQQAVEHVKEGKPVKSKAPKPTKVTQQPVTQLQPVQLTKQAKQKKQQQQQQQQQSKKLKSKAPKEDQNDI